MASGQQRNLEVPSPGHYTMPSDLSFANLVRGRGTEAIRIRFFRGEKTILDLPLSAETLSHLAAALLPFQGYLPEELPPVLAHHRRDGTIEEE